MPYVNYEEFSKKCTRCGECLTTCPVMEMGQAEAAGEIERLVGGQPTRRVLQECALCIRCNEHCPEGLRPHELILQRISDARAGRERPAALRYAFTGTDGPTFFADLYRKMPKAEQAILDRWSEPPAKARDVLMVGCIGRTMAGSIENSKALASIPKFGPRDLCCGEVPYRTGEWASYEKVAGRAYEIFKGLKTERLVCYCASCTNFFGHIMPEVYGKKPPFEVISLYEWLLEEAEAGRLEVKRPSALKAAVSESCYCTELGDPFRETLRRLYRLAGVETVELEHSRERGLSCGASSLGRDLKPKDILKNQRKKFAEVRRAGVRDAAFNCPGCYMTTLFTAPFFGVRPRYMADELLYAFGDASRNNFRNRIPLYGRVIAGKLPLLVGKVPAAEMEG